MNQPCCLVLDGWSDIGPSGCAFPAFNFWCAGKFTFFPQRAETAVAVDGTFRNLRFKFNEGASVSTRTVTLYVNGVATLLSVTLGPSDEYAEDLTHEIAVSAGDYVYWRGTDSGISPARTAKLTFEFDGGDDVTSIYPACGLKSARITSATHYDAPLSGGDMVQETHNARDSIVGCDGTLTTLAVRLERAPGVGSSRTFALYKNGVRQDGSGGTIDTTVTISDTDRQGLTTFSLPLVGLDLLYLEATASGSPLTTDLNGTVAFVADNPGEFQVCGSPADGHTAGTEEYNLPQGRGGNWTGSSLEYARTALGPINAFSVHTLYSRVSDAILPTQSFTHTLRKNGVDTEQTNTINEGETFQFNLLGAPVEITSDDEWSMGAIANVTEQIFSTWTFVAGPISSPSEVSPGTSPEPSPDEEPPDREPPSVTPVSPDECPCPPPDGGANPNPTDPNAPPTGPGPIGGGGSGNSGTNPGGDGFTHGLICDGLGTVSDYDVATPGEAMTDVRNPRTWMRMGFVEFDDDDTETDDPQDWALDATMPDAPHATYGGRKAGKAFTISPITRGMSDDNGNYVGARVSVSLNDKGRDILRTRLGDSAGKYVWEREGIIYTASEANRQSGYATPPRELFRGLSYDIALGGGFTASISLEDRIASQFGAFGPDRAFSSRLLTLGLLPGCPREIVGKPQQWIFGEVSDEGATDIVTGEPASKGLVPLWLVGSLGDEDEYHLAAHAIGGMTLYGSDGNTPPARVLLDPSTYRVELLNLTDADTGDVHVVTHVFLPTGSVPTEAHKSGGVNMAANVCGVLGSDGNTITQLFYIYQAFFELLVLPTQESLTGQYGAVTPTWADGRAMIHSDSFEDAQQFSIDRIGGNGYLGGFVLGGPGNGPVTLREILRRMSNSGDCWFTWTSAGQLKVVLLDDTADLESTDILREPARLRALPTPSYAFEEVENPVLYAFDWDDDKRRYRVAQARVQNERAFIRMGRPRPSPQPVEMRCVRDAMTARDVASRRLLRRQYPPAYFPIVEPIDGLDRDPGDMIRVTSIEGPGSGCVERPMFIKQTTYDPNTRRVTHVCRDLTEIIEGFGEWADVDLTWDTATEEQQEEFVFWANDDDLIPTELVAGQEWR